MILSIHQSIDRFVLLRRSRWIVDKAKKRRISKRKLFSNVSDTQSPRTWAEKREETPSSFLLSSLYSIFFLYLLKKNVPSKRWYARILSCRCGYFKQSMLFVLIIFHFFAKINVGCRIRVTRARYRIFMLKNEDDFRT